MNSVLKKLLDKLSDGQKVDLIGDDIIKALTNYSSEIDDKVTFDYSAALLSCRGDGILADKDIYEGLMLGVEEDPQFATFLCDQLHLPYSDSHQAIALLKKSNSGTNSEAFLKSFAHLCGLDTQEYEKKSSAEPIESSTQVESDRPLHDFQKRIKDEIIREILSPDGSSILVHMPTGSGKTRTCMEALIDFHRAKSALGGQDFSGFVVWLAHSTELCEQACDTFRSMWTSRGDYPMKIVRLFGDAKYTNELESIESAMIFATFQKYNAMKNSSHKLQSALASRIERKTRLVVVDEAHRSLARTYAAAISGLTNERGTRLIGLTATPGRSTDINDEQNDYLKRFFGGDKIGLKNEDTTPIESPIKFLTDHEYLAKIERVELKTNCDIEVDSEFARSGDYSKREDLLMKASSQLALNSRRNKMLLDEIYNAYEKGESVLVFACSSNHCRILEVLLKNINVKAARILSTSTRESRERRIEEFKTGKLKVLLNYGVLSTGFDAPNLNTLIIARPVSSIVLYSQIIGRALRGPRNGGNHTNKVIDLIDNINIMGEPSNQFSYFDDLWNPK